MEKAASAQAQTISNRGKGPRLFLEYFIEKGQFYGDA